MTRHALAALVVAALLAGCAAPADPSDSADEFDVVQQLSLTPDDIVWGDGPASLPPGSRLAVLSGDPSAKNPITMRLQFPANYEIAPHWHPANEHVTILSGTLYVGVGDELDRGEATPLPAGSFAVMPKEVHHYAFTQDEPVTLQVHSNGPWGLTFVGASS